MSQPKVFQSQQEFVEQYREACATEFGTTFEECAPQERYFALAKLIASKARAIRTQDPSERTRKKVYYFSLEFLVGPLLDNYLINFGVRDLVADGVRSMGTTLEEDLRAGGRPGPGQRRPGPPGRVLPRLHGPRGHGRLRQRHALPLRPVPPAHRGRPPGRVHRQLAGQRLPLGVAQGRQRGRRPVRRSGRAPRGRRRPLLVHPGGRREGPRRPVRRAHRGLRGHPGEQAAPLVGRTLRGGLRPRRLQRRRLRPRQQVPLRRGGHLHHPVPQRRRRARPHAAPQAGVPVRLGRPADHPAHLRARLRARLGAPGPARLHPHQRHAPRHVRPRAHAPARGREGRRLRPRVQDRARDDQLHQPHGDARGPGEVAHQHVPRPSPARVHVHRGD